MFLNYLKAISGKIGAKSRLEVAPPVLDFERVKSIGLVVDAVHFPHYGQLLQQLHRSGVEVPQENIVIYSRQKITSAQHMVISESDFGWKGEIKNANLAQFVARPFDVLINYFATDVTALQQLSAHSHAHLKIGFASVSQKSNHLMIETTLDKYQTFTAEMLRYLTVLKKM